MCEVKEQLSFEYEWSSLEDLEMIDAKVVTKERFDVYLISGDHSFDVTVERNKEIMRLVDQEGRR